MMIVAHNAPGFRAIADFINLPRFENGGSCRERNQIRCGSYSVIWFGRRASDGEDNSPRAADFSVWLSAIAGTSAEQRLEALLALTKAHSRNENPGSPLNGNPKEAFRGAHDPVFEPSRPLGNRRSSMRRRSRTVGGDGADDGADLPEWTRHYEEEGERGLVDRRCPSSDDLRHIAGFQKGGSGSSVIEIMRHAVDAASDGLRLSGA